jgi:hypothetical protein
MRKRLLAATSMGSVIAVALIVSLTTGASAEPPEAAPAAKALSTAEVRDRALWAAGQDGEMAPTEIEAASGTLAQSAQATDPQDPAPTITDPRTGRPWAESPVEVVTMRGQFTSNGSHPPGTPEGTGTVLTVTIDKQSGRIVSRSLGNTPVALDGISPTVTKLGG